MSFISVSPGEIFAVSKSLYRIWKDTKGARERHCKARQFATHAQASSGTLRDACNALGTPGDEVLPYLNIVEKAYDDLTSYLDRFEVHFAQSANTRGTTQLAQEFRLAFDQLDHKVESLQSTLTAALTMCSLALVPRMSLQISSMHQPVLSQSVDAGEVAALVLNQLPDHAQVARITTKACWQRPRGCYCRCHISHERPWHSTLLGTIGIASMFVTCNRVGCTRRYAVYTRVSLSQFGIPLAIRIATELKVYGGLMPVLYPTIDVQRVCDFASPGFRVLDELAHSSFGITSKLDEEEITVLRESAKAGKVAELKRLFASGEASPLDVDPDGRTWLEKLFRYPWPIGRRSAQFELLEFLGRRCAKDISSNPRLLAQISRWIGEGPQLSALSDLIKLKLDPGAMDPSFFHIWPRFSDPDWQAECMTPDPFGVEFIRQCLKVDPQFADCDLLITHLLFGSGEEFDRALTTWIANDSGDLVNAFGQSAVHLAIHSPSRLERVLHAGMDADAMDRDGTTPLMYAAAYGRLDSVITLLQHVKRLDYRDKLNHRCFVHYAIRYKHLDLIKGLVSWLRDGGYAEDALWVLDCSVNCYIIWAADSCLHYDIPMLETLFEMGGDPDAFDRDNNTAMHLVNDAEHAKVLLKHNFTAAGVQNKDGKTALMHITRFFNPGLTEQLLYLQSDAGISIDQRDSSHWSAMLHLVGRGRHRFSRRCDTTEDRFQHKTNDIGCMNLLLRHEADVLLTDACGCPCSPSGCSAMSIALHHALEGTRPVSHNNNLDTLPIDLAIEVVILAFSVDRLRQLAGIVAAFSDFIQSGKKHSCCALGAVRPLLVCNINGAHATDSQTRVTERPELRNGTESVTDEKSRLTHQLARFYTLLERRSRARYEDELASKIKTVLVYGPERPSDGNCRSSMWFGYCPELLLPQRLDLQDYRAWVSDCNKKNLQMYTGMSLEAWSTNALEFVDGLDREMERLRAEAR